LADPVSTSFNGLTLLLTAARNQQDKPKMTADTPQEPTPSKIAEIATQQVNLPPLALLGIFGSIDAPAALVRETSGKTTRVVPGDAIDRYRVAAIGDDRLILTRGARSRVLILPQG
jgi:hypothetical protein